MAKSNQLTSLPFKGLKFYSTQTGHFRDEYFQATECTSADDQRYNQEKIQQKTPRNWP